jgi:hypothetical protein
MGGEAGSPESIGPITAAPRALVTTEAILGFIVVGLFLNALAGKAATRQLPSVDP